ncbi:MAG: DUF4880 domain-containing protein [Kiloniellales bacterium]
MDDKITDTVFEEAIQWAVVLGSGTVSPAQQAAFTAWLQRAPAHETAWRRLQEIDGDFNLARTAAEPAKATLAAVRRGRRRKRRAALGGLSAIALLFGVALAISDYRYQWTADVATGTAERRTLEMAGGGRVHVNGRTSLDIESTAQGTMVRVHKGAIVVQSGGTGAPIGVSTAHGTFRPVGTRYVVTRDDGATDLSVIAGTVSTSSADGGVTKRIGAGAEVRIADGDIQRLPATGLRADAWVEGIIEADDAPLSAVLDSLAAQRRGWLLFDDEVAALRVSGVFRLDDTDRALAVLERVLPIELEQVTDWIVRVRLEDAK